MAARTVFLICIPLTKCIYAYMTKETEEIPHFILQYPLISIVIYE
jgi:hypothetical protein